MNSTNASQTQSSPTDEPESSGSAGGVAGAKERIKSTARDAAEQVKTAASSTMAKAKEEAGKLAGERKRAAAERLGGYSSAIHDSAKSLEENDPNIAWFTHRAADRLQSVADYVRERDLSDLRSDAENLARRHPAVFFGGLFVAGLLVGNLLKARSNSSSRNLSETSTDSLEGQSGEGTIGAGMGDSPTEGSSYGTGGSSPSSFGSGTGSQMNT